MDQFALLHQCKSKAISFTLLNHKFNQALVLLKAEILPSNSLVFSFQKPLHVLQNNVPSASTVL